ncbi:MAG: hypothetical protein AAB325_14895, partial [Pseudomonadota bacterium]
MATGMIVLSTVSFSEQAVDLNRFQGLRIEVPKERCGQETLAERYAQLKRELVASGVPLLSDDEIRAEIQERKGVKADQVFIAIASSYAGQIRKQLPQLPKSHYSLEPMRKDRGPALGLALLVMSKYSKDKIFATAWADDHITQGDIYHDTLSLGAEYIKKNPNSMIAVGIKPVSAHTGFCYVQSG